MNERIRLLSEQAHRSTTNELAHLQRVHNRTYDLNESAAIYNEKFAELMIQDCIRTLHSNGYDDAAQCLQDIHFGIEDPI